MQAVLSEQAHMKKAEEERLHAIGSFEHELSEAVAAMSVERSRMKDERGHKLQQQQVLLDQDKSEVRLLGVAAANA